MPAYYIPVHLTSLSADFCSGHHSYPFCSVWICNLKDGYVYVFSSGILRYILPIASNKYYSKSLYFYHSHIGEPLHIPPSVQLHPQNVCESVGASKSVWKKVESTHRNIKFRRESDPGTAFRLAIGVTCICDIHYQCMMGVNVISLGAYWSSRINVWSNLDCHQCNLAIQYKI